MDLGDVMDEVGTKLATITGLRVFAYPVATLTPPGVVIGYPESITYDETYGRGMDRMNPSAYVVVGRPTDRSTRDAIAPYVAGSGASSVKAALETGTNTAYHTLRVVKADFDVITIGGTDYLAAVFELDIAGAGSS